MTYSTSEREDFALPLPIPQLARDRAAEFASQQPVQAKAEQVRLNTLAVSVVNDYLQMMGVVTNLQASDSWNSLMRLFSDVADLELPGLGRLECRPVHPDAQSCQIPAEVWLDRIGYAVVEIDDQMQEARLLGFTRTAMADLPLSQLQPPEDLWDYLYQLRPSVATQPVRVTPRQVNLGQWLEGLFDAGWDTLESLLNPPQLSPAFAFRGVDAVATPEGQSQIIRGKLLDLTEQNVQVVLLVEVSQDLSSAQTQVRTSLYPYNQPHLPTELELQVLDDAGSLFLQARSRNFDSNLQLQFSGSVSESFSIQVLLDAAQVREDFVI